jgi:hypothetical protein
VYAVSFHVPQIHKTMQIWVQFSFVFRILTCQRETWVRKKLSAKGSDVNCWKMFTKGLLRTRQYSQKGKIGVQN